MDDTSHPPEADSSEPGTRVLVIEDDPDLRSCIVECLSIHGFRPTNASDGLEGLRMALEEPFAVIVSDVRLPGLSGIDLTRRIARSGRTSKVILMTAFADPQTLKEGLDSGALLVISKPVSMRRLASLVREALHA